MIILCIALFDCSGLNKTKEQKATSAELSKLEQKVHQLINQYRVSNNLKPLTMVEPLTEQARIHSESMANKRVPFGHQGFDRRVEIISRSLRHRAAAENVAYNQGYSDSAQKAVQIWLKHPGHRGNIAGNYRFTGIGVAKNQEGNYYFTQIFWQ